MSELLSTGNETIDSMRGLQRLVDEIDRPEEKIARVRFGLTVISATDLFNNQFLVNTASAFAKLPDSPEDERLLFNQGLMFTGSVDSYRYMLDQDVPVDSLVVSFADAQPFGDPEDGKYFKDARIDVPVLAIDSFLGMANSSEIG